jgi:hypothetical protein
MPLEVFNGKKWSNNTVLELAIVENPFSNKNRFIRTQHFRVLSFYTKVPLDHFAFSATLIRREN